MDDSTDIDLKLLVAFRALLETQSVSLTAERLSLSQSAVSGMLKRLRATFGDPLFVRSSHGVRPTPRALELDEPVREVLDRVQVLLSPSAFDPTHAEMTVAISGTDYSQATVIQPTIARLRQQAPGMRVAVKPFENAALAERLATGAIDLALTVPEFAPPDLPSRRLFHERYCGVVGRHHPLVKQTPTIEAMCAFDHAMVSPTGGGFTSAVDRRLEALGHRRRVAVSAPNAIALAELLEATDLVALLPERMLRHHGQRLFIFEPPFEVEGFTMLAVWHRRTHLNPAYRWVRDQLSKAVASPLGPIT